jgi:hypothetical protein
MASGAAITFSGISDQAGIRSKSGARDQICLIPDACFLSPDFGFHLPHLLLMVPRLWIRHRA